MILRSGSGERWEEVGGKWSECVEGVDETEGKRELEMDEKDVETGGKGRWTLVVVMER